MLVTYITELQIESVKSDLLYHNKGLKPFKSSHLTEALAFAFGFKTNAAMRKDFEGASRPQCVEFCKERFWHRISELSDAHIPSLQDAAIIDLSKSVSRATGIRDFREQITLPSAFETRLENFFKQMAVHGAAYFTIDGCRLPPNDIGFSRMYRQSNRQAMRPSFTAVKPSMYWQWDYAGWSALLADDFLEDHIGSDCDLSEWALKISDHLEPNLSSGNVEFNAEIGVIVQHEEIAGCTASILYQRPGQLEEIRAADANQQQMNRIPA
ncbi:hypothetical protein [Celeribacter halophilus]|uniref:hypothetical protein n=1 Tax=Celeribacter halophilus TaxID=576117 RepID=UPI001C09DB4C|nr:hypothetical protein [Celeribacter halophilus]MBU2888395.1 hypothetical protein [Celeribacter halophilus]MDO6509251.1 hypothetical protein [Celeribacter halophilus]